MFRPPEVQPFSTSDQALCLQLLPYIAHALQESSVKGTDYVPSGQSSMVLTDKQGTVVHLNASAKRLLSLATDERGFSERTQSNNPVLPSAVVNLCKNLDALFKGEEVPPPVLTHTNSAGRFIFRAYWLDQVSNDPNGFIGVTIEHQEPIMLKITRNLQFQPLSITEKEVALLWAQNYTNQTIGHRLHIKPTTVKCHIRNIYTKLDINERSQLLAKLVA